MMIDFCNKIKQHLEDENKDVISYMELAEEASDSGYAQILKDIAYEESIHAKHLKDILEDIDKTEGPTETENKVKTVVK